MDFFSIVIIIVLIVILFLLNKKVNSLSNKLDALNKSIILGFDRVIRESKTKQSDPVAPPITPKPKPAEPKKPSKDYWSNIPDTDDTIILGTSNENAKPKKEEKEKSVPPIVTPADEDNKLQPVAFSPATTIQPVTPKKPLKKLTPPKPSFMERNPDLEKFIGENLLSKIGIVIFVIGMGFLVKLGIDNNYITEGMRVILGVVIGGGLIGLAHKLRKSFMAFSSVLIGGGLSVLYFTIAIAFHEYQILPQTAAFIIMVLITAFGVLLSVSYDKKELAILALIGGFGTPFFLSTGEGNVPVLFSYILILNIGMLALVYFKKWNIINYLSFGFTVLLYMGVYSTKYVNNPDELRLTMFLFLTAIYLIFYGMALVFNIRSHQQFKYAEIGQIFINTALYFGFGLALLSNVKNGIYLGVFTVFIALINFGIGYVLFRRKNIDKNIVYLIIGLVLTFVSLIAPIQLEGNQITLFWAFEAVLLLWLYFKTPIKLLAPAALIINVALIISLLMDWQKNYAPYGEYVQLSIVFNQVFISTLFVLGSIAASIKLFSQHKSSDFWYFTTSQIVSTLKPIFVTIVYFGILLELNYQFNDVGFAYSKTNILLGIYNMAFMIILFKWSKNPEKPNWNTILLGLASIMILSYITGYLYQVISARDMMLSSGEENFGFYWHYILLVEFVVLVFMLAQEVYSNYSWNSKIGNIALYAFSALTVIVISAEVIHLSIIYQFEPGIYSSLSFKVAMKSVIPVVWGTSALLLMITGMHFKQKTLRIASLALFLITVVKLFLYDLQGNTTGKIVSFIALGAILLGVSFLYQKLKFIIQDDQDDEKVD